MAVPPLWALALPISPLTTLTSDVPPRALAVAVPSVQALAETQAFASALPSFAAFAVAEPPVQLVAWRQSPACALPPLPAVARAVPSMHVVTSVQASA